MVVVVMGVMVGAVGDEELVVVVMGMVVLEVVVMGMVVVKLWSECW